MKSAIKSITVLSLILTLLATGPVSAIERMALAPETSGKIQVYLKPDVTILVDGEEKIFQDVNGSIVYPIIYNGSTYLPVRAISRLMNENIEWNAYTETIFIGKTLSNPNKVVRTNSVETTLITDATGIVKPKQSMISAYLRPNFMIMYDFQQQVFHDAKNNQVFPIVVNGTTYLPVRAVSALMNQTIEWDGLSKTITILSPEEEPAKDEKSQASEALIAQFEEQVILYDNATVKVKNIQAAATQEELLIIASEVSKDYATATEHTSVVNDMDTMGFTDTELDFYESLKEFTVVSEQYILVLENIAYLAADQQDYSMLIEVFVNFVIESQRLLDQTRELAELL